MCNNHALRLLSSFIRQQSYDAANYKAVLVDDVAAGKAVRVFWSKLRREQEKKTAKIQIWLKMS